MSLHRVSACVALILGSLLGVSGCNSYGPPSVARDRFDYQVSYARSLQEQLLFNLVKLRYQEMPVFLDVSSVINSYSLEAEMTLSAGFDQSSHTHLFGGTGRYADRPTITYAPVQGESFSKNLLRPLPPDVVMALVQSGWSIDYVLRMTVRAVNGVFNSSFVGMKRRPEDADFFPVLEALERMQESAALTVHVEPLDRGTDLVIDRRAELDGKVREDAEYVNRVLGLGGLRGRYRLGYGSGHGDGGQIMLLTRSLLETMNDVASGVDVPAEHVEDGRALRRELVQGEGPAAGVLVAVKHAKERPDNAVVAVRHHGYWFYVDDRDLRSKRMFSFLSLLTQLSDATSTALTPVLSVPTR
ncbi:MAG: hypothetical protein KIT73_07140 [Burkholderiales bacterium]|nr:hypothetical protein [Burkholderiales bacterium]